MTIPRREELERDAKVLHAGGPTKADLFTLDLGRGRLVVKDFSNKAMWVRWIGRLQISREYRAYRWLGEMEGIPRCAGRIDRHALAIEWIDGEQLGASQLRRVEGQGPRLFRRLEQVVERVHRAGMVHLDLRGRENILVGPDGSIHILDLASAQWFRDGSWAKRWLFHRLCKADRAALMKWKLVLRAGDYTDEERAFLRSYHIWRSLWIFNRKRPRIDG